jgi:hypothetical protein
MKQLTKNEIQGASGGEDVMLPPVYYIADPFNPYAPPWPRPYDRVWPPIDEQPEPIERVVDFLSRQRPVP